MAQAEQLSRSPLLVARGNLICTGETYKDKVKLTFAQGASLPDHANRVNASLEGGTRLAIDVWEEDEIDERVFGTLVGAAWAVRY